jgi:5-dehydro-2-deoxygluconokinase
MHGDSFGYFPGTSGYELSTYRRDFRSLTGENVTAVTPDAITFEVLTMGRISVDLYPLEIGLSLREVSTFSKSLGGSPTNVAVAAARYGRSAAVITRTGNDHFGEYLHDALRDFNVDDRYVSAVDALPTPLAFCEIYPPDNFPLYFYRYPKAPDLEIRADELDLDAIRSAGIFWATVTGLSDEPSRSATIAALKARAKRGVTILDLDYRPMFWPSREEARKWTAEALNYATVAVGNLDECEMAVVERNPVKAIEVLHKFGVELAIVKQGPAGVMASDGVRRVVSPPLPTNVVNGLGAGDAFGGALCHGLLADWDLEYLMHFCNAAGSIVASQLTCSSAMPTELEVEAKIRGDSNVK